MWETITDGFKAFLDMFKALVEHQEIVAVFLGVLVSSGLVQLLKFPLAWRYLPLPPLTPTTRQTQKYRFFIRLVTITIALPVVWAMWPGSGGWAWGLATGGLSIALYWATVKTVGRWVPWLSATKDADDPPEV